MKQVKRTLYNSRCLYNRYSELICLLIYKKIGGLSVFVITTSYWDRKNVGSEQANSDKSVWALNI